MRVLILGCGRLGGLAAGLLLARGHIVLGIRRTAGGTPCAMRHGDFAEPATWDGIGDGWDAILLTATPGLRRGRDHRLDRAAILARQRLPAARLVYTGTTAVYGDAGGAMIAEDGPLAPDAGMLLAIEEAVLVQADALVLRLPALVGAGRDRAVQRARDAAAAGTDLVIPGDPDRPFSIIHESDAAVLAAAAIDGVLAGERGILNAAAPDVPTARAYYAGAIMRAGVAVAIASDGSVKPSRAIDAGRLHALLPDMRWRGPWD